MKDKKNLIVILTFLGVCFLSIYFSFSHWENVGDGRDEEDQTSSSSNDDLQESFFTNIDFYKLSSTNKILYLNASELTVYNSQDKIIFFDPVGYVISDNNRKINYKGKRGLFFTKKENLILEEEVHFASPEMTLDSDKVNYMASMDYVLAVGNVITNYVDVLTKDSLRIYSDRMTGHPEKGETEFIGNVKGKIKRKRIYEESVDFKSNEMYGVQKESKLTLKGDVYIKKQEVTATSRSGEIYLDNYNKKLKYYTLSDDVKLVEKVKLRSGESFTRKAFAEKLDGYANEGKVVLTGYPKVFQLGDVISGNRITVRENNQVVEVDDANTNFILK